MSVSHSSEPPIHLPGLNGIRFYAALSVLVGHVSNNFGEMRTQPSNYPFLNTLLLDPQSGVNLFFVLSGFLITYLLLREKAKAGEISIQKFYVRRVLRIWPLYYAILLICLSILPVMIGPAYPLYSLSWTKRILLLLLLPNFLSELGPLSHLWSIGLEEQFYLTWPWVVNNQTKFLKVAFGIVLVKIILTPVILMIGNPGMTNLFTTLRFESMAIGAIGAYLFYTHHPISNFACTTPVKGVVIAGFGYLAIVDVPLTEPMILISSLVFLFLILNVVSDPIIGAFLDTPILDQLGKISYGIYMAHYPVIYLVVFTLHSLNFVEGATYDAILYSSVIAITFGFAFGSYYGFEQPFLKLKARFAVIPTQNLKRGMTF